MIEKLFNAEDCGYAKRNLFGENNPGLFITRKEFALFVESM
jgi:hypothetical protein